MEGTYNGGEYAGKIMENINQVLVGKETQVEYAMIALLAGGHLLLEDVPGVGKTTLANALARSIDVSFGRIQFTPDTLPSDVTGISVYNMKAGSFEYREGAIMNHILLADEINRTSPKTQAALLEAMEEKQVTVDGTIYPISQPFMVIATQNPIDFLGTYNLPEAQLDRFLMKISLGYPDEEQERKMANNFLEDKRVQDLHSVADQAMVLRLQEEVRKVKVQEDVAGYIIQIIRETRGMEKITLGASPRATLALIRAAQAEAFLKGRTYVIPDDVQKMIKPVLSHRLVLSMEAKLNKITAEKLLEDIKKKIKVPILKGKL